MSGSLRVVDLLRTVNVTYDHLKNSNNVSFSKYNSEELKNPDSPVSKVAKKYKNRNVSDYISDCNIKNKRLCAGLILVVTSKNQGNLYYLMNPTNRTISDTKSGADNVNTYLNTYGNAQYVKSMAWFWRIVNNKFQNQTFLPVIPQEVSDQNSAEFSRETMMGRSVSYQLYESSSREVSFTLQLRADLVSEATRGSGTDHIYRVVSLIESCCYPNYENNNNPKPPEVAFQIADQFFIRGVLTSCSATWSTPIINGKYVNCNLSLGVVETTGPYGTLDIQSGNKNYDGQRAFRNYNSHVGSYYKKGLT